MLTSEELKALRGLLARAEACAIAEPTTPDASDVAQLHPLADPIFGGMLFYITATRNGQARGFLLRPHRGGCREAWLTLPQSSLHPIGRAPWPGPEFARRCEAANGPHCRYGR